ncbi:unnamed protein product [Brugia timori]|uniref:Uncharacterized protein n=1 Tax=Brugia timori TaxID=42155 RepID=A0A0R3QG40_9BILA|nr:unnamed protein product [Brugia timori]
MQFNSKFSINFILTTDSIEIHNKVFFHKCVRSTFVSIKSTCINIAASELEIRSQPVKRLTSE